MAVPIWDFKFRIRILRAVEEFGGVQERPEDVFEGFGAAFDLLAVLQAMDFRLFK